MKWYISKLIYRIVCGDGAHTPQFDEQLRLIEAVDLLQAYHKARYIGKSEEDNFFNQVNKPVCWKFIDIAELQPLDKLVDGAEVYSRIAEEDDGESYIRFIKLRSAHLLETASYAAPALN
ncbi:DUF4288 domain-containing protein [Segetibacter sp. 3557_3]|uniref:DUF4288 domain-containing protein n=1 Tax=Segetibacter sp. 3557_3 TaxID=2547429 RepID=UPI0010584098|nr:DUF4288 domain-containing protein [Segetibacter sp. 3557_3]TDH23043.1 DUF4288 domain-containing protein [Segetibacter sp. 3557_3]